MGILDADGHIWESEAMFANVEEEFYPRRPVATTLPLDADSGDSNRAWIIEGKVAPRFSGRGLTFPPSFPGSPAAASRRATIGGQTLENVEERLQGMDEFGIERQVVYPTLFLESIAEDVRLEAALYHAYNNYLGAACARSHGRLLWAACVPWRDPEAAVAEVRRASELGASAIYTMGVIFDRQLDDPSFFPVHEAASEQDLPVCVHLGWGAPAATQLFTKNAFFCSATIPVIWGFVHIMASGLLSRFPELRVGFIESGAQWVPYVINQLRRHYQPPTVIRGKGARQPRARGIDRELYRDPAEWFREGRAFVTFEADEDLPHLLQHLGEDGLMMSTDYPHGDASADEQFVDKLMLRQDISASVKEKLLGGNAARFYRV
ncbi:MAG: amidohydrolase family protein [Chloroflexi bacterium]|nr:amidohydrolase family protein [Chloroflexota bacterium]